MLALYIYIVLDRNKKQILVIFYCVGLSDNPIWTYRYVVQDWVSEMQQTIRKNI